MATCPWICVFTDFPNKYIKYDIHLTAIGFTPGGSSTHLHTNSIQNAEHGRYITIKKLGISITIKNLSLILEVYAVPRLCELYPGICLTTTKKLRKNLG
jgi:hypothetical protein